MVAKGTGCLLCLTAVIALGGCAAIFDGTSDIVHFTSTPPGATVEAGDVRGTTPFTVEMKKSVECARYSLPGYPDAVVDLDHSFMFGFLVLDILLTPGYGAVGCLIDGLSQAWWSLPKQVNYDFKKGEADLGGTKLSPEEQMEWEEEEREKAERKNKMAASKKR